MGRAIGLIIFGTFVVILMALGLTACSPQSGVLLGQVGIGGVSYEDTAVADHIVIAGKITDPVTGKWLNNYTVIPYFNDEELSQPQSRAISRTDKYPQSGEGVHDGCFVLYIPNRYELTASHVFVNGNQEPITMRYKDGGLTGRSELYLWLGEVHPGDLIQLGIPDKQIEYAIAVMPEDNANLNPEIHQNSTVLDKDGRVTKPIDNDSNNEVLIPETTTQISWTREYTVLSGTTIWDSWKWYVEGQVPEMNWSTYYAEVVQRNPDLVRTGYFVQGQTYYLPLASSS